MAGVSLRDFTSDPALTEITMANVSESRVALPVEDFGRAGRRARLHCCRLHRGVRWARSVLGRRRLTAWEADWRATEPQ